MPQAKTDVVLRGRVEGLGQVGAAAQEVGQRGAEAMAKVDKEVKELDKSFQGLTEKQVELTKTIQGMDDKASPAYKKLRQELQAVHSEAAAVERTLNNVQRATREADKAAEQAARKREKESRQRDQDERKAAEWADRRQRQEEKTAQSLQQKKGAFSQGLLQGAIPQAVALQRGPGMVRQAAGARIGGMLRNLGGSMAQMPFSGAAGLSQAVSSLPGGGLMAMPLNQSLQYAQKALAYKGQRQQIQPFLQTGLETGGMFGATADQQRARITKEVDSEIKRQSKMKTIKAPIENIFSGPGRTVMGELWSRFKGATGGGREGSGANRQRAVEAAGGEQAYTELERQQKVQTQIAKEGVSSRRRETLQDMVQRQGQRFGFGLPGAMQKMGQITQAGGGVGRELRSQGLGTAGLAAERLYGIGGDVTGAFLQGGRSGGVMGGMGQGGSAMVDAIAGGMRLGLEGSELTQWMSQMAGDVRNWQQTGIPINPGSLSAMGAGFAKIGLGSVRGGVAARGMTAKAQELSTRGPRNAEELILLQELGGLRGTGVEDYEAAQIRLEEGDFGDKDIERVMGRFLSQGGEGARGRKVFQRAMGQLGIQVSGRETQLIDKKVRGGTLSKEEKRKVRQTNRRMARVAKGAPKTVGGMGAKAAASVDPDLVKQAGIENQEIGIGSGMIDAMQSLEKSTRVMGTGFNTLTEGPLTRFSEKLELLTKLFPVWAKGPIASYESADNDPTASGVTN